MLSHAAMSSLSSKLLNVFLLFGAIGPLPSIILYVFLPYDTVDFFNGKPSDTAAFWCSVNASADAVISFLCFNALLTHSVEVKVLVLRSFAVYAVFHWGAFWWWTNHGDTHPSFMASGYPVSIAISIAAMVYWTYLQPIQRQYENL